MLAKFAVILCKRKKAGTFCKAPAFLLNDYQFQTLPALRFGDEIDACGFLVDINHLRALPKNIGFAAGA